jgi:hypothetical protein
MKAAEHTVFSLVAATIRSGELFEEQARLNFQLRLPEPTIRRTMIVRTSIETQSPLKHG